MNILFTVLFSLVFQEFCGISPYLEDQVTLNELKRPSPGVISIFPFKPVVSYSAFKTDREWISYYQLNLPILSLRHLYFPFIYYSQRKLHNSNRKLNLIRARAYMFEQYLELWYVVRKLEVLDSLIEIEKKLLKISKTSEKDNLSLLKIKKKLIDLMENRRIYFERFMKLLRKYGLKSGNLPEESPEDMLNVSNRIKDSLKKYRIELAKSRADYERRKRVYSLIQFTPELSYMYVRQFINTNPLNPIDGREIKAISLSVNISPLEIVNYLMEMSRKVHVAEMEYKLLKLDEKEQFRETTFIEEKIKLVEELRSFCERQVKMWKAGILDYKNISQCLEFYLLTKEDMIDDIHRRCRIDER